MLIPVIFFRVAEEINQAAQLKADVCSVRTSSFLERSLPRNRESYVYRGEQMTINWTAGAHRMSRTTYTHTNTQQDVLFFEISVSYLVCVFDAV